MDLQEKNAADDEKYEPDGDSGFHGGSNRCLQCCVRRWSLCRRFGRGRCRFHGILAEQHVLWLNDDLMSINFCTRNANADNLRI
jgi:hypothetical protein